MTTRNLYAVLIACFLVLVFVECAHAAPTLKVTPGTECGAAGVGKVRDGARWVIEAREATPQWRVNPKGVWVECKTPDCPAMLAPAWGPGGRCEAPAGAMFPSKMIGGIGVISMYPKHPLNRLWLKCTAPASPGASAAWTTHREICVGVGGKDELPRPRAGGPRVLPGQRVGHLDIGMPRGQVDVMPAQPAVQDPLQLRHQRLRQRGRAVLAAFAVPDGELQPLQVQVFDPQVQRLAQSQARSVQQLEDQAALAFQAAEQRSDLITRKHFGDVHRRLGTHESVQPRKIHLEHMAIKEQQRAECLPLRGLADAAIDSQAGQECFYLRCAQVARMAPARPEHEASHPVHIGLLGLAAVMPDSDGIDHGIGERAGLGGRCAG